MALLTAGLSSRRANKYFDTRRPGQVRWQGREADSDGGGMSVWTQRVASFVVSRRSCPRARGCHKLSPSRHLVCGMSDSARPNRRRTGGTNDKEASAWAARRSIGGSCSPSGSSDWPRSDATRRRPMRGPASVHDPQRLCRRRLFRGAEHRTRGIGDGRPTGF